MFLNAVILVLQEILEAALLVSVLLVLIQVLEHVWGIKIAHRNRWVVIACVSGILGAWGYAAVMPTITQWFDYVGQEITNAGFQLLTIVLLVVFSYGQLSPKADMNATRRVVKVFCIVGIITLAIMREGAEIILYLEGIMGQPEAVSPVLLGGLVASGIGISCGIFLYFGLQALSETSAFRIAVVLLGLFAGNMAAQAVLLLTQADWLPYSMQLWDSSELIAEYSVPGQLLYALIGYEATPSLLQVISYVGAFGLLACSPLFTRAWTAPGGNPA